MQQMQQMQIQGTEIQIKEYQGKRVVTLKDIDAVHQRKSGTASRNFNQNRNRFIEDVDFFRINVTDNEIRSQFGISPNAGGTVILITETGYLMLVKSFTDDLAWKVQRELVDSYFRARAEPDEECMQEIIESGVPTVVVATDKLIQCAEIMAGCIDEINQQNGTDYQKTDVYFEFTHEVMSNEQENEQNELTEAQKQQVQINTLLSLAQIFGDDLTIQYICDVLDIDYEDVKDKLPDNEADKVQQVQDDLDSIIPDDEGGGIGEQGTEGSTTGTAQ